MAQVTIKYSNSRMLRLLKDLAKYFDFVVSPAKHKSPAKVEFKGVSIIPGDASVDPSGLEEIFTGKNLNAGELRKHGWQKRK